MLSCLLKHIVDQHLATIWPHMFNPRLTNQTSHCLILRWNVTKIKHHYECKRKLTLNSFTNAQQKLKVTTAFCVRSTIPAHSHLCVWTVQQHCKKPLLLKVQKPTKPRHLICVVPSLKYSPKSRASKGRHSPVMLVYNQSNSQCPRMRGSLKIITLSRFLDTHCVPPKMEIQTHWKYSN